MKMNKLLKITTAKHFGVLFSMLFFATISCVRAQTSGDLPRQGFLGAQIAPVPADQRASLKLPDTQGIVIMRVEPGSSAEVAGLKPNDVILKAGETSVNSTPAFINLIRPLRENQKIDLTILRDGKQQVVNVAIKGRPFETSPDFDVLYRSVNTSDGRRRVIITKPKANGKFPAVLLVGGIGCYSLDNFPPSHAYRKILYSLTNQGFATMRVEKSGMGDSEGAPCDSPHVDVKRETEGYVAGLKALKTYDFVDADKTFIFGHSIGGIVGPLVAAEVPVRGIIVADTVATNWAEYEFENYRRQAVLRGVPYEEIERNVRQSRVCKEKLWYENQTPEQITKEIPNCAGWLQAPASYTYMRQLVERNFAEMWKKVTVPVLIIYGSSDFLTSSAEHVYLRDMINSFQNGRAKYVEIPQMDHYFERAATQKESYDRREAPPQTQPEFAEQSLTEISGWLKQNLSNPAQTVS